MNLVLIVHPNSLGSVSMPRFARMIAEGMTSRGHNVRLWSSASRVGRWFSGPVGLKKWAGYVDQFVLYPREFKKAISAEPRDTLFVVTDHALGPWIPAIAHRPHVVHCHDFLAQRSALGEIPEHKTGWTGRRYQQLIRRGYRRAKHFVSVSHQTEKDLLDLMEVSPASSRVVHNGLNGDFRPIEDSVARDLLSEYLPDKRQSKILLHVGGNQWYKNRAGVIDLYSEYQRGADSPLPLWMIGTNPDDTLLVKARSIPGVRFLPGLSDEQVIAAYNLAELMLYPSLAEGFGWPIAEAMACGTPVLTTHAAPMSEVGGNAAIYLRRMTQGDQSWAKDGAKLIHEWLLLNENEKASHRQNCLKNAKRFAPDHALDQYEDAYRSVLRQCI